MRVKTTWLDAVMQGVDEASPKPPTLEEIKLTWFLQQNKVTKRTLKKYIK